MLIRKFLKDAVPTSMKRRVRDTLAMFRPWHHLEDLPPRSLKFETTNLCNANCVFCGYQYQDRSIGVMSMELFERALQDYVGMGGENISFTPVVGEPLVDHNIFERIRIAKRYPQIKNIYFHTNGILLARKNCVDELLTSGLSELRINTAGFDRTLFERVYRSKMYDQLLQVECHGDPWKGEPPGNLGRMVSTAREMLSGLNGFRIGARRLAEERFNLKQMVEQYLNVLLKAA